MASVTLYTITAITGAQIGNPTNSPGTGYAVGDVLTVLGGQAIVPATLQVTVNNFNGVTGAIGGVNIIDGGLYTSPPANPASMATAGAGSGATFSITWSPVSNETGDIGPTGPTGPAHTGAQGIPGPTKAPVRVCISQPIADLTNVSLTQDGVTLAVGDRVLVAGQTDGIQNGIYYVSELNVYGNYTYRRPNDANLYMEIPAGLMVWVTAGNINGGQWWVLQTTVVNPVIGTDLMTFVPLNNITATPMPVGKYISVTTFMTPGP